MFQVPEYKIKRHERPAIAQVYIAVYGRAAYVHTYSAFVYGFEEFFFP
jgi:hypothetical protein